MLDIAQIIKDAKLGGARKDAQIDACEPFACALRDALRAQGIKTVDVTAAFFFAGKLRPEWYHAVVEVSGVLYDISKPH